MAYRQRHARFNANEYWDSRPLCAVCAARKTRNGTICHKCRKAGHMEPVAPPRTAPVPSAPTSPVTVTVRPVSLSTAPRSHDSRTPKSDWSGLWIVAAIFIGIWFFAFNKNSQPVRPAYTPTPLQSRSRQNGDVYVRGHYRSNGTYVRPHVRTQQNHIFGDNFSTSGNYNPYSGKSGARRSPNRGGVYLDRR
jgi:hypothetical protein